MITIPHPLVNAARARASHPALICREGTHSYAEMQNETSRLAARLVALGVGPGSSVVLSGEASGAWVMALHAIGWLGASAILLPPGPVSGSHLDGRGTPALNGLPAGWQVADLDPPPVLHLNTGALPPLAAGEIAAVDWDLAAVRLVVWTSGTSGAPRTVALTGTQLLFNAFGSAVRLGFDPGDRWLVCLPLHHIAGAAILLRSLFYASTVVLHEDGFDAAAVSEAIDRKGVTMVSLVPTMLKRLLSQRAGRPFPRHLRVLLVGGAPVSEELRRDCQELGAPAAFTWGMSETASGVATSFVGTDDLYPLPFATIDTDDGVLRVRGPLAPEGEFVSHDRGSVSADGRVIVAGRRDAAILTGGETVDPSHVAAVLQAHPEVTDAAVVGEPDAEWGQRVVAVVATAGAVALGAELDTWCRDRLPKWAVPRRWCWVSVLPRDGLGKLPAATLGRLLSAGGDLEASAGEASPKILGPRARRETLEVDADVDVLDLGSQLAVLADNVKGEGDRAVPEVGDGHADQQPLAEPHGPAKIGGRVLERHTPPAGSEERLEGPKSESQHLFEGRVTEFEETAKEHDSGAIDLVEAGGQSVLERHDDSPENSLEDSDA